MARLIYSFAFYLIVPFAVARLFWRSLREPLYTRRFLQRFGFCEIETRPTIWVHAVSAGETIAVAPLIRQLAERYPVVVTNMTATGNERAHALLGHQVSHAYAPYDLPGSVKRFIRRARPRVAVFVDTELWPNMIHYAARSGVCVILANARLSEQSANRYRQVAWLSRPVLADVTFVESQTAAHAARFQALGVAPERIEVAGSVKFDMPIEREGAEALQRWFGKSGPVFMAGSTHDGEEENAVVEAFVAARAKFPGLTLILVPRHPHRFDGAAAHCEAHGLVVARRSADRRPASFDVLLVDTMGEMRRFYSLADVAFVGGSIANEGGHNLLEAVAWNVPVLMGPHLHDIDDIAQVFVEAGALKVVRDARELEAGLCNWLHNPGLRSVAGAAGRHVFDVNEGATEKVLQRIRNAFDTWGQPETD